MSEFDLALAASVRNGTALLLAGLGEVVVERAGLINIGIEGVMLAGAFGAFAAAYVTGSPVTGALAGMAAGAAMMLLFALLTLKFTADQIVTGMALNLIALGMTGTAHYALSAGQTAALTAPNFGSVWPQAPQIPILSGLIFSQSALTLFALIIIPLLWYYFERSERGLELRAVGENPAAAQASGVDVLAARWRACIAAGCLGGLGGAFLTISQTGSFVPNCTAGRGFIALAAVVIGRYRAGRTALACILFGAAFYIRDAVPSDTAAPQLINMIPYVLTLITLSIRMKSHAAPAALGKPWRAQ